MKTSSSTPAMSNYDKLLDPSELRNVKKARSSSWNERLELHNNVTKKLYADIPSLALPGVSSKARLDRLLFGEGDEKSRESAQDHFTFPLVMTSVVVLLTAFQFGYHIGVINAPQLYIQKELNVDDTWWSFIVSIWAIGGWIGGSLGGTIADKIGRKEILLYNNVLFLVAAALMYFATSTYQLLIARFIAGLANGAGTVAVPMYLGEIAPPNLRGTLGSCNQLGCVIGILVSQLAGLPLAENASWWRPLLLFSAIPSVLQLLLAPFFLFQSPRYALCSMKNEALAKSILISVRGYEDVTVELESIKLANKKDGGESGDSQALGLMEVLSDSGLRKIVSIGVILQVAQQWSGINAIMFYSSAFFKQIPGVDPILGTILVGAVNALFTLVSIALVEKLGRRSLLLWGTGIMATSCVVLTFALFMQYSMLSIACVLTFVGAFEIGLGPIAWLMIAEIFPSRARAAGMSVAVATNWLCSFAIGVFFPPMNALLKNSSFVPFFVVQVLFILYGVCGGLPETQGKTLEEIEVELLGPRKFTPSKKAQYLSLA